MSNALVRQLGARESDAAGAEADVTMFTQAQRKLRFNFRVVGISERPEDTFRLLRAAFGWLDSTACPLHSAAVHTSSSEDHLERPDHTVLEALRKRNAFDVQLYASAHASFERALAKLPEEAAPEPMFVDVHGADSGGQDSKKSSKGKKKKKKVDRQKKKETTIEKDSDGEKVDSHSDKVDSDGETAGSDGEKADSDGEKVDSLSEKADSDRVPAQEAVSDSEKVDSDQADAGAEKADDGNDAGEAPPLTGARQKALLTAQWITAQEADASSPDANPLADASDETGDA